MQTTAWCLAALLVALLLSLRARRASVRARSGDALEEAAYRLRLERRECEVLYHPESDEPLLWWQGKLKGLTVGLLDSGVIWVGESGDESLCVFKRKTPGGAFLVEDSSKNDGNNPLIRDPSAVALLMGLSRRVKTVSVLGDALEAEVSWSGATASEIVADARALTALKLRVDELDPPLVRAILRGDEAVARALLRCDADIEALTLGRLNAMTAAAGAGMTEIVRVLLAAGAKAAPAHGFPLHAAAAAGSLETVKLLLGAGVAVDARDERKSTALIEAAAGGHHELVAFLLSKGADAGAADADGGTALEYAEAGGFSEVIAPLRAAGRRL